LSSYAFISKTQLEYDDYRDEPIQNTNHKRKYQLNDESMLSSKNMNCLGCRKGERISDVQKSFSHIVNHLMSLGKSFDKEELNIKILKCLDRSWQPKVTAIF